MTSFVVSLRTQIHPQLKNISKSKGSCTPCARHVHAMCTPCARHVHAMCTPCARHVHAKCTPSARHVHAMCFRPSEEREPSDVAKDRTFWKFVIILFHELIASGK